MLVSKAGFFNLLHLFLDFSFGVVAVVLTTLGHWAGHCGNHPFGYCMNHLLKK